MSKRKKQKSVSALKPDGKPARFELYFFPVTLILALPFVYSYKTMDVNLAPRILVLSAAVLVFAVFNLLFNKKQKGALGFVRLAVFPVAGFYIVWSLISLIGAVNPGEGTFDVSKSAVTLGLLIYLTQIFTTRKEAVPVFVKSVIISAVIATAVGLYQYITRVQGKSDYELYMALYAVKGLMAHKNQFSISLLLMLPFVIYGVVTLNKWWKIVSGYAILMILVNITLVQTRSVWVATLFFLITFILLGAVFLLNSNLKHFLVKNKKMVGISVAALLLISVATIVIIKSSGASSLMKEQISTTFSTQSQNAQWRLKMWNASLQLAGDHLWLGVGAGNWKMAIIPYYHLNFGSEYQNWGRPHNDFLWVLTEKGILGFVLFISLFGILFYYGFKLLFAEKDKNRLLLIVLMLSGITGYLFVSLFTFPLERINHQVYLVLMMAVVISYYYRQKPKAGDSALFNKINFTVLLISVFSVYFSFLYVKSEVNVHKLLSAMNRGNQRQVIRYADKAYSPFTTVDYNNVPILMYKGVAYMRMKRFNEGYAQLKAALDCFPNQVAVLNNIAISASELHKNKESAEYFNRALYLFPHYEESLSNMVIAYYRSKQYKKAYLALLNQDTRKPNKQYNDFKRTLERYLNSRTKKQ